MGNHASNRPQRLTKSLQGERPLLQRTQRAFLARSIYAVLLVVGPGTPQLPAVSLALGEECPQRGQKGATRTPVAVYHDRTIVSDAGCTRGSAGKPENAGDDHQQDEQQPDGEGSHRCHLSVSAVDTPCRVTNTARAGWDASLYSWEYLQEKIVSPSTFRAVA